MFELFIFAVVAIAMVGGIGWYTADQVSQARAADNAAISGDPKDASRGKTLKIYKDAKAKTLIGVKDPYLAPAGLGASAILAADLAITFDTTTYIDRALLKAKNNHASVTIPIYEFSIRGKQVIRLAGLNGYIWEQTNYADIEQNGEREFKLTNNFITSQAQVEDVGDYCAKELTPHDMYSVSLPGMHPYFEVGDRYTLQIEHQLPTAGSQAELIDVDVEVRGVSMNRSCKDNGETVLSVRVPSGEWNKTTSTRARMIAYGMPFNEGNRSNFMTVGASNYPGQADIYCDGTADDVQIQAAIDSVAAQGGGTVLLSTGDFYIADFIALKDKITLRGQGNGTVIRRSTTTKTYTFLLNSSTAESKIIDFILDLSNVTYDSAAITSVYGVLSNDGRLTAENITVSGLRSAGAKASACFLYGFGKLYSGVNCTAKNFDGTNTYAQAVKGFFSCDRLVNCTAEQLKGVSDGATEVAGFYQCRQVFGANSLVLEGSGGTSLSLRGYDDCTKISTCITTNSGTGSVGYYSSRSVQQCKSVGNATHYTGSYADSGTANACADTAAGGYNS